MYDHKVIDVITLACLLICLNYVVPSSAELLLTCYAKTDGLQPDPPTSSIDPHLCTHLLIIGCCFLNADAIVQLPTDEFIQQYVKLKKANKNLKVVLTMTPRNEYMSKLVLDDKLMDQMLNTVGAFIERNNLDGFDYDWEFPAWSDNAKPSDVKGFDKLLQKTRVKLDSFHRQYQLFVTVAAPYTIVDKSYDVAVLNKVADYVQIMNYDFHAYGTWTPFTGFNAPLRAQPYEISVLGRMNSDYSTKYWIDSGMDISKLVFGIPTYGRGYTLLSAKVHHLYAPATGISSYGDSIDYQVICPLLNRSDVTYAWNVNAASPYIYFGREWIGLEDKQSVIVKTRYAKSLGLAGVMVFALHCDDPNGTCAHGSYPLTNAIKNELYKQ